jgi:hypothetical protein
MAILEKFAMRKFITLLAAIYCQPLLAIDIDPVTQDAGNLKGEPNPSFAAATKNRY